MSVASKTSDKWGERNLSRLRWSYPHKTGRSSKIAIKDNRSDLFGVFMQNVIPALRITNYEQSKRFYTEAVRFRVDWEHRFEPEFPVFMQISRGGMVIYLSEHRGDCQPQGLVHLFVDDVDAW